MKKNLLSLVILAAMLLVSSVVNAQVRVLDEGFETTAAGQLPAGWTQDPAGAANHWAVETGSFIYPASAASGNGRVKFSSGKSPAAVKLITPAFNITAYEQPILVFSYAAVPYQQGGIVDSLKVWYRYSPTAAWRLAKSYGASDVWKTDTIDFTSKTTGFQVAFEGIDHSGHGVVLDNVIVTGRPTCQAVNSVSVFRVTHDAAIMTWHGTLTASYNIKLYDHVANPATDITFKHSDVVEFQNNHSYSDLDASTTYYYYIQSDCGLGDVSGWVSGTFKTACPPVTSLVTSFEDANELECWTMSGERAGSYPLTLPTNKAISMTLNDFSGGECLSVSMSGRTGSRSLLFNTRARGANDYTKLYAVSPRLADAIDLHNQQLDFWVQTSHVKLKLRVMVSEYRDDLSNAEEIGTITLGSTSYEKVVLTFENMTITNGRYIVFYTDGSQDILAMSENQCPLLRIDDLNLHAKDDCNAAVKVSAFKTPVITPTTALLLWNPSGAAKYHVKVSSVPFAATAAGAVLDTIVTTPSVSLAGLDACHRYFYFVQAICADGTKGVWSVEQRIETGCPPEGVAIPFYENFEAYVQNEFPACWTRINPNASQPPYIQNCTSPTNKVLYIYNNSQTAYSVTPKLNATVSELQMTFKMGISQLQMPLSVGVMTDPNDASTYVELASYTVSKVSSSSNFGTEGIKKLVRFNNYKGNGQYIAFKYTANNVQYFVDNVIITPITDCITPDGFRVIDDGANTLTLDWTPEYDDDTWEVAYGAQGFVVSETSPRQTATTHPFVLTGLQENATYDLYLRSACNGEYGAWVGPVSGKTLLYAAAPYLCDFETTAEVNRWSFANSAYTNQWVIGGAAADDNNGTALYISKSAGTNNDFTGATTIVYAYRPVEVKTAGTYDFGFKWRWKSNGTKNFVYQQSFNGDVPTTNGILRPFLVPVTTDLISANSTFTSAWTGNNTTAGTAYKNGTVTTPAGWIALTPGVLTSTNNDWRHYEITASVSTPGKYNLVFFWFTRAQWLSNSGSNDNNRNNSIFVDDTGLGAAIDSVSINANTTTCVMPENLVAKEASPNSVKISFVNPNATNWTVKVFRTATATPEITTTDLEKEEVITTKTHTITELTANTQYYVYVKANCGGGWTSALTFRTLCAAVDVPFREDFESYNPTALYTTFPSCWNRLYSGTNAAPYVIKPGMTYGESVVGDNTSKTLAFVGNNTTLNTFAVLPAMKADLKALQISFRYAIEYDNSQGFYLVTGVMADPLDASTFVGFDTVFVTTGNIWKDAIVLFDEYQGTGKHIAFQMLKHITGNSTRILVDDIVVDSIQGCISPKEITVSDLTPNSAKISWRVLGTALNYRVKVNSTPQASWKEAGDIYDNVVLGTNQIVLNDLKRNMLYYVYVRTDCGDGTYSAKTSEKLFRTLCPPTYSLPFDEDFESYTALNAMPSCWIPIENPLNSGALPQGSRIVSLNYKTIDEDIVKSYGEKSFCISSQENINALIATPAIDISSLSNVVVSFKAVQAGTNDRLIVGAISDVNNPATFVGIDTLNLSAVNHWEDQNIDFGSYTGNGKHIAFFLPKMTHGKTVYIDNLSIRDKSVVCPSISSLRVSQLRATTASVNWTDNVQATGYEYKIASHDIDPEISAGDIKPLTAVGDNFVHLTDLTAQKTYYIYVRSVCSATSKGYWSKLVFTTLCGTLMDIPFEEGFNNEDISNGIYFPECWTYSVTEIGTIGAIDKRKPYVETAGKSLQMEAVFDARDGSYSVVQVVTPELNVGDTIQKHQLKFKMKANNINALLMVGIMSDPSDASTFVPYDTIFVNAASTLEEKVINLLYTTAQGHFLAFRLSAETAKTYRPGTTYNEANARGGYTVNIDDISVTPLDACMPPYKVRADARPAKALINWLPGDETTTQWTYYYSTSAASADNMASAAAMQTWYNGNTGNAVIKGTGTVSEPSLVLYNLDRINYWGDLVSANGRTYNFYLVSDCGKVSSVTKILIQPNCTAINEVPYSENFNRHGVGAVELPLTTEYPVTWDSYAPAEWKMRKVANAFPDCWKREDNNGVTVTPYPYIETDKSLYFYSKENTYSFAALPQIANSIDLTKQSIYFRAKGESATDTLQVGFSNGTYATFEKLADIAPSTDWANYEVELAGYTGSKRYVSFLSKTSSENKVYIDDLEISPTPFCIAPAVTVEEVTKTSYRLSWNRGINTLSNYQTLVVPAGTAIDALTPVTTQDSVLYGDNLPANTAYDIYVRANCSNGLHSDWTKLTVRTLQEPAVYPYSTDYSTDATNWAFENVNQPNKWIIGQATGYPADPSLYITNDGTSYGYDIDNAANVYAYRSIAIPAGPHKLSFWWKGVGETGNDYLNVYLVPQSTNFATATPLNTVELSGQSNWTKTEYDFYVSESNTEAYNLVFQWKNNAGGGSGHAAAVDDIKFAASTECTVPEQLEARQITPTSAVLNWVSYNASSWYVKIFTSPQSNPETGTGVLETATTRPYKLGHVLEPGTRYYFYVQSECNQGVWSQAGTFVTACEPATTLNESFNAVPANCWGLYEGLLSNVTADSWNLKATNAGWTTASYENFLTASHAVLNVAGAGTKHWLVSPAIKLTQNTSLAFDLALTQHGTLAPISNANGQADDKFAVSISEDGGATWTAANTTVWNNDGTGKYRFNDIAQLGQTVDIDLFQYNGKTVRIAFYGESTVDLESNDIHIDNARIECRNKRTFNVNTCAGYRYQAYGFDILAEQITVAGNYQYSRVVPSTTGGCDTTYVLNLTVISNTNVVREATICSNAPYSDADFSNLTETGIYYSTPKTAANGCDSIIELHLTVNRAYTDIPPRTATIDVSDLPFTYACRTFGTGTESGVYDITCKTALGCDSIIRLTLTVNGTGGFFEVENEEFTLSPNPSKLGEKLYVNYNFTLEEQAGLQVEIFNTIGVRTAVVTPTAYPIALDDFSATGVYVVRITTGTSKTMYGKVIIQ